MRTHRRSIVATLATVAVVALGAAAPAAAQTKQDGLVNVAITDNTVQVPIGVAANVCGVTAAVLSQQIRTGDVDCTAFGESAAFSRGSGSGKTRQNGLVNIAVTDNVIQIPVSVAANVCGVGVAVLSQYLDTDDTACTARSRGQARA
jgi:hypothetical protein